MNNAPPTALAMIRAWDWQCWDFDLFQAVPRWRTLSDVVNQLAMDGHSDAPDAILELLCDGKLVARGNFQWRAYRRWNHFERSGHDDIPPRRWQELREVRTSEGWSTQRDLPKLEMTGVEAYSWDWQWNRFSTAVALGDEADWGSGPYSEESYSAWDVDVHFASAENDNPELTASEPPAIERSKGGRPPIYDWETAKVAVTLECASRVTVKTAQAEIEEALKLWFSRRGESPSDSRVRDYAGPLLRALKAHSAGEANNLAA